MLQILIAVLVAAVVWWLCAALGLPSVIGLVAAVLVLIAAASSLR